MPSNPYQSPDDQHDPGPSGLWPHNRRRRERMVGHTVRSWLLFALRTLIFLGVIVALLILTRGR